LFLQIKNTFCFLFFHTYPIQPIVPAAPHLVL